MPKRVFNKDAKQLYGNRTSPRVFFACSLDVHNTFGWLLLFMVVYSFLDLRIIIKPNSFSK